MLNCFTTQRLLDQLNEAQQVRRLVVTDVEHPMWSRRSGRIRLKRIKSKLTRCFVATAHHTFNDVIDIGEVALHLAIIEHFDRLTSQDCPSKQNRRHIWSAQGPHREKPQTSSWQSIEVAVCMSHQLIGLLALHKDSPGG